MPITGPGQVDTALRKIKQALDDFASGEESYTSILETIKEICEEGME